MSKKEIIINDASEKVCLLQKVDAVMSVVLPMIFLPVFYFHLVGTRVIGSSFWLYGCTGLVLGGLMCYVTFVKRRVFSFGATFPVSLSLIMAMLFNWH